MWAAQRHAGDVLRPFNNHRQQLPHKAASRCGDPHPATLPCLSLQLEAWGSAASSNPNAEQ